MINWKGCGTIRSSPSLRYYPGIYLKELREITKTSFRIIGVLADIQNGQLSNTSLSYTVWLYFLKTRFNIFIVLSLKSISYSILSY
jgi:hypothetical protein